MDAYLVKYYLPYLGVTYRTTSMWLFMLLLVIMKIVKGEGRYIMVKIIKEYLGIAERLREERIKRDWTLKDASKRIGIGVVFLSEIERALKVPSAIVIHDIAKVYGLDEPELALAFNRTPISVEETLSERVDFLDMIYELKNTKKLNEEEKDELVKNIIDMFKDAIEKKEGD
jgi:transcriptional regulator with XRE-family HTH domain